MVGRAKQQELFHAINERVMDLRVEIQMGKVTQEDMDRRLFLLVEQIWRAQCAALGIRA